MCRTCFESFIRFGGTETVVLSLGYHPKLEAKQHVLALGDEVRKWVEDVWHQSFGATAQAILKTKPFEFSAAGLSDLDTDALRDEAVLAVQAAIEREGLDLGSVDGQQRALAVLSGFQNQAQQSAMQIEFYVWTTQQDDRVRGSHAERHDQIFRWDTPPAGGHPSEDFGCRCYARALGVEGYWARVAPSVDAFVSDLEAWEGNVDHMYLDTRGFVTVGKGMMLPDAASAIALPFRHHATDTLATAAEIRAEFDLIAGMEASQTRGAAYYEPFTTLYLSQADIDRLVEDHVRGDFEALLRQYADFGNLPLPAQIALWDMIYNLGPAGLAQFRMLRQAILDGDWAEAAEQSRRLGPSEERNQYVFDLFMDAAEEP
jgi:GH24 family phage-related lysozyme (muramidase)